MLWLRVDESTRDVLWKWPMFRLLEKQLSYLYRQHTGIWPFSRIYHRYLQGAAFASGVRTAADQ